LLHDIVPTFQEAIMGLILFKPASLIIICAISYAVATFAMKEASESPHPLLFALIALALGTAAVTEIMVLRQMDLAMVYILILAAESLLVVALAGMIGEGFGPREAAGAAMVLVGTAILSS
jgi:drug/metabolite transporter (DMT)-like permease